MPRHKKTSTGKLVAALTGRPAGFERTVLDALEDRADPDAAIPLRVLDPPQQIFLPALAVAAVIGNQTIARGLLQSGASPATAHLELVNAATIAEGAGHLAVHRQLMKGLRELGIILDHRISDLQTFGRSISPFSEPFRPSEASLNDIVAGKPHPEP